MLEILKNIARGYSLARILMNLSFRGVVLRGRVVDVGGARNPDYFSYFDVTHTTSITPVDGSLSKINFEKDILPYSDGEVDTVILCNVLEHIFNYQFLLSNIFRILKGKGRLVGFVPFLVQYHPDPHDFFRYTHEALERLLKEAGFEDVHVLAVGGGPLYVQYNTIMLSLPRVVRPALFIPYYFFDRLFLVFRPFAKKRYPLGYTFYATKPA